MFYKIAKTSTSHDEANLAKVESDENDMGSVILSHDIEDDEGIEETRKELQGNQQICFDKI